MSIEPTKQPSGMSAAVVAQIRAERAARSLTIEQLSEASGVPLRTLARKLTGERDLTLGELDQIARGLGMTYEALVHRAWSERR